MDIKLNLPKTNSKDWNELFSPKYHRMFRVSDTDGWGIQDKSMDMIKKQIRSNEEFQSLVVDQTQFLVPEKKTLAIRGLGYWVGSLQWDRDGEQGLNTVITGSISKYWLAAPVLVGGLALGIWFFKDIFGFLKPVGSYPLAFVIFSLIIVGLIGVLNYFVHYQSVKSILKQMTVFLKYKGVSYEFGDDVYDADKALDEARRDYEKQLLEASHRVEQSPAVLSMDSVTTDYIQSAGFSEPVATEEVTAGYVEETGDTSISAIESITQDYETGIESEMIEESVEAQEDVEDVTEEFAVAEEVEAEDVTDDYGSVLEGFTDESAMAVSEPEDFTEEFEVPKIQESEDEIVIEDVDIVVPDIEEEESSDEIPETYDEARELDSQQSEKIKLMSDGIMQTSEMMGVDEYDSEIGAGIDFDDSAYELNKQNDIEDDESEIMIDDADATQIDNYTEDILSPDDAFAQGFSPNIMGSDELDSEEIVIDDEEIDVPDISEEDFKEDIIDNVDIFDDEEIQETEEEVIESVSEIEAEEDGFGDEFDSKLSEGIEQVFEEAELAEKTEGADDSAFEMDQNYEVDQEALSEISEMTDTFAVPEIAEGFNTNTSIDEPDIPDEFMTSEITQDMGLKDEDISVDEMGEDQGESEFFDVPDVEEQDEEILPEDFMVPEIEEDEGDSFDGATEYVVDEYADDVTNIESYGDGFLSEQMDEEKDESEESDGFGKDFESASEEDIADIDAAISGDSFNIDVPSFDDDDENPFEEKLDEGASFSEIEDEEQPESDDEAEENIDQTEFFDDIIVPEIEEDLSENDIIVPEIDIDPEEDDDDDWAEEWK